MRRTRQRRRCRARELRAELALGALLLAAVAALALLAPSERALSPLGALGADRRLRDRPAGPVRRRRRLHGPSQLVLMPMLLLAPPALVPLLVAAGLLVGRLPRYLRREVHPDARSPSCSPTPGTRSAPAVVIGLLAPARRSVSSDWPVLALALAAQVVFDAGFGRPARLARARASRRSLQLRLLGWIFAVDVALAPVGVLAGVAAERQPLAVAVVLPLMGLLVLFARERRARIDNALALSHAYRGTALLMSDLLEADDAYTGGEHSHGVVALALAVGDALGLDARDRRNLEFAALLHDIGKIRVPDEIINKPGKLTDEEFAAHQAPSGRRAGDARARRRRARRGRDHRPPPPRALGRRRLPRRHRRRGDPAGGAHHLRLRRLQRDDHQPPLPRRAARRRRGRRARALLGRAVRPGRGRRAAADGRQAPRAPPRPGAARARQPDATIRSHPKAAARIRR